MGNKPIKKNSHALGEHCSASQRLVVSLTAKELILTSPYVNQDELLNTKNLPEEYIQALHENGLYDKYLTMQKMEIVLPKKGDKIKHFLSFVHRYGNLPGIQPQWKGIHVR